MLVMPSEAYLDNVSATDIEVDSRGLSLRGDSIGESIVIVQHPKTVGGKYVEKSFFFKTDARPHLFIVVYKLTQVWGRYSSGGNGID